jgi:uncharacterized protein
MPTGSTRLNPLFPRDKNLSDRFTAPGPKRMLALDGGGTRGTLTLGFLAHIEQTLRDEYDQKHLVLSDYFDLIGGTSVGSMLATLLALGNDVAYAQDKFNDWAPRIFERSRVRRITDKVTQPVKPVFKASVLRGLLQSELYDWPLRTDRLKTGLCIVSKRVDTSSVWAFVNNPNGPYFESRVVPGTNDVRLGNGDYKLIDIILASTAAPSFFSPKKVRIFSGLGEGLFVDGGVSPHNNPALQLFMMAGISGYNFGGGDISNPDKSKRTLRAWPLGDDKLLIVSVGTGSYTETVDESLTAAGGAIDALKGIVSDGQELALTMLQWMSQPGLSWPIDRVIGDLSRDVMGDNACSGDGNAPMTNRALLAFQRYDVRLEQDWLKEQLAKQWTTPSPERDWIAKTFDTALTPTRLKELQDFTNPSGLDDLAKLGAFAARHQVKRAHFR